MRCRALCLSGFRTWPRPAETRRVYVVVARRRLLPVPIRHAGVCRAAGARGLGGGQQGGAVRYDRSRLLLAPAGGRAVARRRRAAAGGPALVRVGADAVVPLLVAGRTGDEGRLGP